MDSWMSCIDLDARPVRSITSISYYDTDNASQTVSASDYTLDNFGRVPRIRFRPEYTFPDLYDDRPRPIVIIMVMGYQASDLPSDIRQAIRYMVADMYQHRDNPVRDKVSAIDRIVRRFNNHIP